MHRPSEVMLAHVSNSSETTCSATKGYLSSVTILYIDCLPHHNGLSRAVTCNADFVGAAGTASFRDCFAARLVRTKIDAVAFPIILAAQIRQFKAFAFADTTWSAALGTVASAPTFAGGACSFR